MAILRLAALRQEVIEIANRIAAAKLSVAEGTVERFLEWAAPGPNRTEGPRWACRGHTRDIRALGHHRASEPQNGRVWPRVRLVFGGIAALTRC